MANMEFYRSNLYNTTTMITVAAGNTATIEFLFDRNKSSQHVSVGYPGNTSTTVLITFANPTVISNVLLLNHNLETVQAWYDGNPANNIGLAFNNSETSTYFNINSVTVSTVTVSLGNTMDGGEKSIGEIIVTEKLTRFERNPTIDRFTPMFDRKQILHEMPDGGVVAYNIKDKYTAKLGWEFITSSFRDTLLDIYQSGDPVIFAPEPTTTGWAGEEFEMIWTGDFDFKHSTNDKRQGYSGTITLRETPSR